MLVVHKLANRDTISLYLEHTIASIHNFNYEHNQSCIKKNNVQEIPFGTSNVMIILKMCPSKMHVIPPRKGETNQETTPPPRTTPTTISQGQPPRNKDNPQITPKTPNQEGARKAKFGVSTSNAMELGPLYVDNSRHYSQSSHVSKSDWLHVDTL